MQEEAPTAAKDTKEREETTWGNNGGKKIQRAHPQEWPRAVLGVTSIEYLPEMRKRLIEPERLLLLRDNQQKLRKQLTPFKNTIAVEQLEKRVALLAQTR